ncbi:MAG TPA: SMI1/KNR4 family protein [Roseiflexaceae bacterium]|nr:SMI1/KNR4 family protein [Roseiflexaceae bacterium]
MEHNNLEWIDSHHIIGDDVIRQVEQELAVTFPPDFVEYAKRYHGGRPTINSFDYIDENNNLITNGFEVLISFDLNYKWNIVRQNKQPPEELPKGVIIFGINGGGGYMCFDYRSRKEYPPIVFWSHDSFSAETVIPLADTFLDFLGMLYEDSDD